jgi:aldehyde dehydrogenase (NAD+)
MPELTERLQNMRRFYESGVTHSYNFRREQLEKLKAAILKYEHPLHDALRTDLNKSAEESWVTETGFVVSEINASLKGLKYWMQPEKMSTNLLNFPSSSFILREPLGVVLVIAPWNYPFQLLFNPLVGAIAAGNCIVLKSSEYAAATARVMGEIIREIFSPEYVYYVEGDGAEVVPAMMNNFRFNHVFYTGSTVVGKIIYRMAAEQLVPVTLELGGKTPCVVESDANIKVAARRITSTKFSNAGQMCVAPDYILVHASRKDALIAALQKTIAAFYSSDPSTDYGYCKIINEKQFNRVVSYLSQGKVVIGGQYDAARLFIAPTVMENVPLDAPVMKEEIFGPVLPVIPFQTMEEAKKIIEQNPDPLSFYIYTSDKRKEAAWLDAVPFGGGCVNNSSWHFTNHNLPFGGRGNSGIGQYHGQNSFEVFSHRKSIMKTPTWFDPSVKYPPLKGKLKLFKWVVR